MGVRFPHGSPFNLHKCNRPVAQLVRAGSLLLINTLTSKTYDLFLYFWHDMYLIENHNLDKSIFKNMQFLIGDNKDLVKSLDDNSIDLIITSPPYKDEDGFLDIDFKYLYSELFRIAKPSSLFFLNFGHLANFKERPFLNCMDAIQAGWKLNDTITWLKTQYKPLQGKKRVNNLTEFIFLLHKGNMPEIDRLSIGVPYKDKTNIGRYADKDLRCRGNIWEVGYETIQKSDQKLHYDRFPLQIPDMCIKLSNVKSGIVLDPFAGSGTTLVAANRNNLDAIGFEKQEKYKSIFESRL